MNLALKQLWWICQSAIEAVYAKLWKFLCNAYSETSTNNNFYIFRSKEWLWIIEMQNVILVRRYLCIYNTSFLEQNYSVKWYNLMNSLKAYFFCYQLFPLRICLKQKKKKEAWVILCNVKNELRVRFYRGLSLLLSKQPKTVTVKDTGQTHCPGSGEAMYWSPKEQENTIALFSKKSLTANARDNSHQL